MLAAERGAGENTLVRLSQRSRRYRRRICAQQAARSPTPTTDDLRGFIASLAERGFKASSLARRLVGGAPSFIGFSTRKENARRSGSGAGRTQTRAHTAESAVDRRCRCAADAGAQQIAENAKQPLAQRLRAARLLCLLEIVYATGLRVSELVALPASAARRDERMLVVRGKGGKERLVPLNKRGQARDVGVSRAARHKLNATRNRNGYFRPSAKQGHLTRQHFARELRRSARPAAFAPSA